MTTESLRRRLDRAAARRLTVVSAGPGYGKTTELAVWANRTGAAWHTVEDADRDPAAFAARLLAAVGRHVPVHTALPPSRPLGPDTGTTRSAAAIAAALAEALDRVLDRPLTLVIDEVDGLVTASAGVLDSLCRQAPTRLRLVLATRGDVLVRTTGLVGRGLMAEVDGRASARGVPGRGGAACPRRPPGGAAPARRDARRASRCGRGGRRRREPAGPVPAGHDGAPLVRGDWSAALGHLRRAAGQATDLPAGVAWRIGLIHYLRGELAEALDTFLRGDGGPDADRALLLSWTAAAHWMRRDVAACRTAADSALAVAEHCGDDSALAAAHTTRAMVAAIDGDRTAYDRHYAAARHAAERAGDLLALLRVHNNLGSRRLEEGGYGAALVEFEAALELAELGGYASFAALATHNRGEANLWLGRLDEAAADFTAAVDRYRRVGSRQVAYPLLRLGEVHRERGDLTRARAAYEQALAEAESAGDAQGTVPALAGLARVAAGGTRADPERAAALAARALAAGPGPVVVEALLAAGWVTLARGDASTAGGYAERAQATATTRHHRAGLAEALELATLAAERPSPQLDRLAEAHDLWTGTGSVLGVARNRFVAARLTGQGRGRPPRPRRCPACRRAPRRGPPSLPDVRGPHGRTGRGAGAVPGGAAQTTSCGTYDRF